MKTLKRALILAALIVAVATPFAGAATDCPSGPGVHYISRSPKFCAVVRFFCQEGQIAFSNQCGCGCIDIGIAALSAPAATPALESLVPLGSEPQPPQVCERAPSRDLLG